MDIRLQFLFWFNEVHQIKYFKYETSKTTFVVYKMKVHNKAEFLSYWASFQFNSGVTVSEQLSLSQK